jgi:hypothetical protein
MVLRHRCRTRGAMVLTGALALAACAPLGPGPGAPVDERPAAAPPPAEPGPPLEAPPSPERPAPPPVAADAVAALIGDARRAAAEGRHETALALAERAQRLDPRAPEPYLVLARAHQALGRTAQARQLALRGLASSPPGSQVRADLEALLRRLNP